MHCSRFDDARRALALAAVIVMTASIALVSTSVSHAQTLLPDFWVTDGQVLCMSKANGMLYLGGWFDYVGPRTGALVGVEPDLGTVIPGFPVVSGQVGGAISDGEGGWWLYGNLVMVGGLPVEGLAHVRADFTVEDWAPRCLGAEALALAGDVLYVGGMMSEVEGQARGHLAAFNVRTRQLLPWSPTVESDMTNSGEVLSLAVSDTTVYVGGWFSFCQGQPRVGLAAVHATTGRLFDWNPGGESTVVLGIVPDGGTVWIGGSFTMISGASRSNIAEVDGRTGAVTSWDPGQVGYSPCLRRSGSKLYVGGQFSSFMGQPRTNLAVIDLDSKTLTSLAPELDGMLTAMDVRAGVLYVAGVFRNAAGQPRFHAAAFDENSDALLDWSPDPASPPTTVVGGSVVVMLGGYFSSVGGASRSKVAAIDLASGRVAAWNPGADKPVRAMTTLGSTVYLAGEFTAVGGAPRDALAAVDGMSGLVTSWNPGATDGTIYALAAGGSSVFAGGYFTTIGGVARASLAGLDASTGMPTAFNPWGSSRPMVRALTVHGGSLYVGGQFNESASLPRSGAASFRIATGALTAWNPNVSGTVLDIAADKGRMFLGGSFGAVGGQLRANLVAVDTLTGLRLPSPGLPAPVHHLAVARANLYVSGDFTGNYGAAPNQVAAYKLADLTLLPWAPLPGNSVPPVLLATGDTIVVGGYFSNIAGQPRSSLAAFIEARESSPPAVYVTWPNGGEALLIGQQASLRWLVTDESPLRSTEAFLSRTGPDGPWVSLGYGVNGKLWQVTGPATDNAYLKVVATDDFGNVGEDRSEHAFRIVASDTVAPSIRVTSPNGLEELAIGRMAELMWTQVDEVGVTRIEVSISRSGPNGPWELIREGAPNDGYYQWTPNGPPCLLTAFLRVKAWDASGNMGSDVSDAGFSIVDAPVPTFVEVLRALPTPSGVRIEWRLADPGATRHVELQRASTLGAEWEVVTAAVADEAGTHWVLDTAAPEGSLLWYRLSGVDHTGRSFASVPVSVQSMLPIRAVALLAPSPNPSRGDVRIAWELPGAGPVRLDLVDVQGREVAVLSDGWLEPGRYSALLRTDDLTAGLYFVRLRAAGGTRIQRLVRVP